MIPVYTPVQFHHPSDSHTNLYIVENQHFVQKQVIGLFKGRRGISPLVATVLLIAFSVALGAVVMSWGETYIEQKAEFVSGKSEVGGPCDAATISIIKVKGQLELCVRGDTIEAFVENGQQALAGIKARVLGTSGVFLVENILSSPLAAGESIKTSFTFKQVGELQQVKLTPIVNVNDKQQFCTQSDTIVEDIRPC